MINLVKTGKKNIRNLNNKIAIPGKTVVRITVSDKIYSCTEGKFNLL